MMDEDNCGAVEEESAVDREEQESSSGSEDEPHVDEGFGKEKSGRKRKRKAPGQRRNLKSKFEKVEDFNPEALSAQTEEQERIRRLELQQSLLESPENEAVDVETSQLKNRCIVA